MSQDAIERIAENHREALTRSRQAHRIGMWEYIRKLSAVDAWEEKWLDQLAGRVA